MLSGSIPFALMRAWPLPDAYAVERTRRDRQDQLPGEPQRSIFPQLGLARYAAPLSLSSERRRNALVTLPRPAPPTPPKINPKAIPIATFPKAKPKTTPIAMPTTIPKPARSVGLNSLSRSLVFFDNWFTLTKDPSWLAPLNQEARRPASSPFCRVIFSPKVVRPGGACSMELGEGVDSGAHLIAMLTPVLLPAKASEH